MLNFLYHGPTEGQKNKINALTTKYIHPQATVYLGPDEATSAKTNEFINYFLEDAELAQALEQRPRIEDKISFLDGCARYQNLSLNKTQLGTLLFARTQAIANIDAALKIILAEQHHKNLHPTVKATLQTSLCLAAIYWTPELFALYTTKEALIALMQPHLGYYADIADNLADTALVLGTGTNISSQLNRLLPTAITNLNFFFRLPCAVVFSIPSKQLLKNAVEPLKQLGKLATQPEIIENAHDFVDTMNGCADAATLERHQGCLASKTIGELGEDLAKGICFLWNSLPGFSTSADTAEQDRSKTITSIVANSQIPRSPAR